MEEEINSLMDNIQELSENIENMIASSESLEEIISDSINECLCDFDIHLKNGLVLTPRKHMRLLSPDKSKVLICYGGLRVDGTTLIVQTRISCWEAIANYQTKEEAIAALQKVNNAIKENMDNFEL